MAIPCVKVASGGLPVTVGTALASPFELASNGFGIPVTVVASGGLPIADATPGGGLGGGSTSYVTWNVSTGTNITLSNGNLTAAAATNAAAQVRGSSSKLTGKYYFEVTCNATGQNSGVGISTASPGGTTLVPNLSAFLNVANGAVFINGGNAGSASAETTPGDVTCVAVDLTNQRIWFRRNNGVWNTAGDPVTNTGGFDISSIFTSVAAFPIVTFTGTGLSHMANFGATAFTQALPSGFTSGWPA
jgi:hypothetical protein